MLEIILVIVLIVLLAALFVISGMKKKKFNAEMSQLREDLKKGDKVMTDSGIVGEVVESFVEEEYKYFVLKSGRGQHMGYYTVHANSIYYVYGKDEIANAQITETKTESEEKQNSVETKQQKTTKASKKSK